MQVIRDSTDELTVSFQITVPNNVLFSCHDNANALP